MYSTRPKKEKKVKEVKRDDSAALKASEEEVGLLQEELKFVRVQLSEAEDRKVEYRVLLGQLREEKRRETQVRERIE
jgi:hypothetical protein